MHNELSNNNLSMITGRVRVGRGHTDRQADRQRYLQDLSELERVLRVDVEAPLRPVWTLHLFV